MPHSLALLLCQANGRIEALDRCPVVQSIYTFKTGSNRLHAFGDSKSLNSESVDWSMDKSCIISPKK